ncbi:MAG: ATP-dependent endonuclease [bacterium]|nr:ATP-dependent endonuclease [bacterium]
MKYKKLSKEQIIISIDRLTRFKNPKDKYLRVFSEILSSNLIEPRLKKDDILNLDYSVITGYATEILNNSLDIVEKSSPDFSINQKLAEYENSVFFIDKTTATLLDNKIDYANIIQILPDMPVNLRWLKMIASLNDIISAREKYQLKFPIREVVLVEGITEEILLPAFSKFLGFDFYEKGIHIIPAGGKNQVVKLYYELAEELKIPIFVLLDRDAEENIKQITPKLRKQDRIHLVSCGEFEDMLPKNLIVKTVNSHFKNFLEINIEEIINNEYSTVEVLEELFKQKGLHEFKKAEFAKLVKDNIFEKDDVSEEIIKIIKEISKIKIIA